MRKDQIGVRPGQLTLPPLLLSAPKAQTKFVSNGGVTSTRTVVQKASNTAVDKSGQLKPRQINTASNSKFRSAKTGITYMVPKTAETKQLQKAIDESIALRRRETDLRDLTQPQIHARIKYEKQNVAIYERVVERETREASIKERDAQEYLKVVRRESRMTPQKLFVDPILRPVDTIWSAIRGIHGELTQGQSQLPSLKDAGHFFDKLGDDIQSNFTDGRLTNGIADFEGRLFPDSRYFGNKGITGHVAAVLGRVPEGFTRVASGVSKLSSKDTSLEQKGQGLFDVVANTPLLGAVTGKVAKGLYGRYGKEAVEKAAHWLRTTGKPVTQQAIRDTLDYLVSRPASPGFTFAHGQATPSGDFVSQMAKSKSLVKGNVNPASGKPLVKGTRKPKQPATSDHVNQHVKQIDNAEISEKAINVHIKHPEDDSKIWREKDSPYLTEEGVNHFLKDPNQKVTFTWGDNALNGMYFNPKTGAVFRSYGGHTGGLSYKGHYDRRADIFAWQSEGRHAVQRLVNRAKETDGIVLTVQMLHERVLSSNGVFALIAEINAAVRNGTPIEELFDHLAFATDRFNAMFRNGRRLRHAVETPRGL